MNIVVISGRVCKEPMINRFESGAVLTEFSISVYNGKDKKTGDYNKSTWLDVKCWSYAAEDASKLVQKQEVTVKGEILSDHWQDKNTGQNRSKMYLRGEEVTLSKRVPKDGQQSQPAPQSSQQPATSSEPAAETSYDDIPF